MPETGFALEALSTRRKNDNDGVSENQAIFSAFQRAGGRRLHSEARQRYQEYLDRDPWGEHASEALAALERLGEG